MGKSRAFTLRIGGAEDSALKEIKAVSGETTDARTIRFILLNWISLNDKFVNAIKRNEELKKENILLQKKISNFTDAFEGLKIK